MQCAMVMCPEHRYTNGKPWPFCEKHTGDFLASPEGANQRPSSLSDFRDRVWKETSAVRIEELRKKRAVLQVNAA